MATRAKLLALAGAFLCQITRSQGQETCGDTRFVCQQGHCCGHGRCCTNYYELWGFWVLWVTVALLVGCCYYQQKRLRRHAIPFLQRTRRVHRSRSGRRSRSRSRSRMSRSSRSTGSPEFPTPMFDPEKMLRLPTYEEVEDLPKDPPAYSFLFGQTSLPETRLTSDTPGGATRGDPARGGHLEAASDVTDSPQAYLLPNEAEQRADTSTHTLLSNQTLPTEDPPPYPSSPRLADTRAMPGVTSRPQQSEGHSNDNTDRLLTAL